MSYIGRYPDVALKSLTVGSSKTVDSISASTLGTSATSLVSDTAIYNYINTFEINEFNASLTDSNLIKCRTESRSSKPNAIIKRNATTCIIRSEDFYCRYQGDAYILNNNIDVTIPTVTYESLSAVVNTVSSRKIEVLFEASQKSKFQEMDSRLVAFQHGTKTCFIGKFIYKTDTSGVIINVKYFDVALPVTNGSTITTVVLHQILFSPLSQTVKVVHGSVIRSNNRPNQAVEGDIWLSVKRNEWYYYEDDLWVPYDGFLLGQVIQNADGVLACSTIDTQHLLVNFNNSLLQHNSYNVMNYHGNSHVTVDKNIIEAPLNERLTWPRYQTFESEIVYCYIDNTGQTFLEEVAPVFKDNVEYLCHPVHYWRCVGYANFVDGKFTDVRTYGKSDYQASLDSVYYDGQVLREVVGNPGYGERVSKDGTYQVKQQGWYQVDLVGGGGGGAGDTHKHKVKHTWVTYSYSDNSFASQGSSASYISVKVYLNVGDRLNYIVGYGGKYKNGDAGETADHGSDSTCYIQTHTSTNINMIAPHGYTSYGLYNNKIPAQQADAASQSGVGSNIGTHTISECVTTVRGNQGRYIYHEDHYYIDLEANVSPVNNQPYCWGAGGNSVNTGHNTHNITEASYGIGGWFKLTYLGPSF